MNMNKNQYVHGYSAREADRLNDQANTLDDLIHHDTIFPEGSMVLEAGCGVGAQTKIIAKKNPESKFISIDQSEESIEQAKKLCESLNIKNVEFGKSDIYKLPYPDEYFDCIFICFVLEHLSDPLKALIELKRVLKNSGLIMAIEGDHGSTFFFPDSKFAHQAIECQIKIQKHNGGNSNIGRELFPLLNTIGLRDVSVSPRMVYVDSSKPQLVEGFIRDTFTAMIEGVGENAVQTGLIEKDDFNKGISDLKRTMEPDGVFCYTFFKGLGIK
jgi:ubiquinone/menaquinone biosynthesis C-methylase UbiE